MKIPVGVDYVNDPDNVLRLISTLSNELTESYDKDEEPFLSKALPFIERKSEFLEYDLLLSIFFPYYTFNKQGKEAAKDSVEENLRKLYHIVYRGLLSYGNDSPEQRLANVFTKLYDIRYILKTDVLAAFDGDPSVRSYTEVIKSLPGFKSILVHRFAHELYRQGFVGYPRELSELAHTMTGIDIHPGASIKGYFFIDHGSGTVIGESAEIGSHVRIYQDVTLGVLHFEKSGDKVLKKGYKRHPTIGDHVVIGAGAKVLGPIMIGNHVNIGANSWIHNDVPDNTTVYIEEHPRLARKQGE